MQSIRKATFQQKYKEEIIICNEKRTDIIAAAVKGSVILFISSIQKKAL
jgi:hypothetical protein